MGEENVRSTQPILSASLQREVLNEFRLADLAEFY